MEFPKIERSRVDSKWCVYTPYFECLCPWYKIPIAMLYVFLVPTPKSKGSKKHE